MNAATRRAVSSVTISGKRLLAGMIDAMPDNAEAREQSGLLAERRRQFLVEAFKPLGQPIVLDLDLGLDLLRPIIEPEMVRAFRRRAPEAAERGRHSPASPRPPLDHGPPGRRSAT